MNRIITFGVFCLALIGCTPSENFVDTLFGVNHNVAVFAPAPLDLSPTVASFSLTDAEIVGKEFGVCVVLGEAAMGKDIEAAVQGVIKGAKLRATITTDSGTTQDFTCQGSSWSLKGRVVPSNEIAACLSPGCSQHGLPVGTKLKSVEISSTSTVHALGAYWFSTASFDRRRN